MASVNKVILVGNAGRDTETRFLPSGQAVSNVSLATTNRRKDKATGEYIEETQWHRITFFERLAEIAGEYVKKGSPIYVEGRLTYRKYTDKDGIEKTSTDIIASELQLLGGKPENQAPRAPAEQKPAPKAPPTGFDDMDDDIPF
jgi:single-strand DNA-binding protein